MTKRQKQALETREKLVQSAVDLLTTNDYENVKISDICARAGTSVGVFYHYFKNKESMIDAIYDVFAENLQRQWKKEPGATSRQAIISLVRTRLEVAEQVGPMVASRDMKLILHNPREKVLREDRFYIKHIKQLVRQEVECGGLYGDPEMISKQLIMMNRGAIMEWCIDNGGYSLVESGLQVLDFVLEYYGKKRVAKKPTVLN